MTLQPHRDPTLQEIAEACLEIQKRWSDAERMRRLRVDLRPTVLTADGRHADVSSESYAAHHATDDDDDHSDAVDNMKGTTD